ncbi:hypothetical protein [Nannocystis pusilla]|uniref:hypothetical protein n=1 Tax=Nannocystis pusilla TaxID=889268 RepID=UPI003B781FD9
MISSIGLGACSTAAPQSSETLGNSTASASNTDGTTDVSGPGSTAATDSPVTTNEPTGDPGTTDASTTALSATTSGEPTTTEDSGTAAPSTTEAMSTTSGETTLGTTGETGETTEPDTGTDTDGTTGGMGGGPCEVDADCKLHDDCCSCYGIPNDQTDPICKSECEATQCEQIGIDEAKCVLGQCTTEKVDCSSEVACDSLPPDCPEGTLPGIAGACWSGACVPVLSCDKVPDCKLCPETQMCVEFQAFTTDRTCLPLPTECNGKASCECADEACAEPFGFCSEGVGEVDLACECPNC